MAIRCPACDTALTKDEFDGLPVFRCDSCLGYLIGNKRVEVIETRNFHMSHRLMQCASNAGTSDSPDRMKCPRCLRKMEKRPYRKMPEFKVDTCKHCDLIWFDAGEIEAIQLKFRDLPQPTKKDRDKVESGIDVTTMTTAQREAFEAHLAEMYKNGKRPTLEELVQSLDRMA